MNVPPSRLAKVILVTKEQASFQNAEAFFRRLASASELSLVDAYDSEGCVSIVTGAATVYMPLSDIIDFDKERARLSQELKKVEGEIARLEGKLSNEGFVAKAPAAVVEGERAKLEKYKATKEGLAAELAKLG